MMRTFDNRLTRLEALHQQTPATRHPPYEPASVVTFARDAEGQPPQVVFEWPDALAPAIDADIAAEVAARRAQQDDTFYVTLVRLTGSSYSLTATHGGNGLDAVTDDELACLRALFHPGDAGPGVPHPRIGRRWRDDHGTPHQTHA